MQRTLAALVAVAALVGPSMVAGPGNAAGNAATAPAATVSGYPTEPPARICGNAAILDGPAIAPRGAVPVDPAVVGDLAAKTDAYPAGTEFWLAPGRHILGSGEFDQVIPKDGNTYVGAPGAVLDGQKANRYAFTQHASQVTVEHLTIQNFGADGANNNEGVVNHDAGSGWVIRGNTVTLNAGAGLFVGSDNVIKNNCLKDNQQYGFSGYHPDGVAGVRMESNEIVGNNTWDWEVKQPGCGCTGGGKFWNVTGATILGNWVHDNRGPGLWADTNDVGFRIEGNYIEANDGEGIFYEISYNALIKNNTLRRNNLVEGARRQAAGSNFPIGAIYLSEAGGESRVNGGVYGTLEVTGNLLADNWGGVVLWENADRFCNSPANTSAAFCTKLVPDLAQCVQPGISDPPLFGDCRWKTQNVSIHDNEFRIDRAAIGCTYAYCGLQAILSNYGTYPDWSPYQGRVVQEAITFDQDNVFADNTYIGDWRFNPYETGRLLSFAEWQAPPYDQDLGSTLTSSPTGNILDSDTATIEGSQGHWARWYSASPSRTTAQAHGGTGSLRIRVAGRNGWGVHLDNWPGFTVGSGNRTVSFWCRSGSAETGVRRVTMTVHWKDGAGNELQRDSVGGPPLTRTWREATADVLAPPGTATAYVELTGTGSRADVVYLDDFFVG